MTRRLLLGATVAVALSLTALLHAAPSASPIADAAMRGDATAVRTLLQQGADPNAAQGDGMTALHWAAERGDANLAATLLYAGANSAAVTRIGQYTPLHLASRNGHAAVVDALLSAGADAGARTTNTGVTPLHLAAWSGTPEVVTTLIARGADANAREAEWGQTPLIFAAARNRVDAIKALLAGGADAGVTTKTMDLVAHEALERAARQRQQKVLDAMVPKGQTPTPSQMQAAVQAARELYRSGKVPEPEKKKDGEEDPANRNFEPQEERSPVIAKGGLTALLHAARQGYVESVRALLDGGADIDQPSDGDATTPLLMAVINGQFDVAMLLIERGADPNLSAGVNAVTPLWAAVNAQWQPRTRFPQPQEQELQTATYLDVMEALLKKGADPNARLKLHPWYMVYSGCGNRNCGLADTAGSTPFWRAAYATDLAAMKILVAHGADPNLPTVAPPPPRRRGPEGGGPNSDGALKKRAAAEGAAPAGAGGAAAAAAPAQAQAKSAAQAQASPEAPKTGEPPARPAEDDPDKDESGLPPMVPGGPGVYPLHAASGVGYGEGFAGNAHRHAPDGWLPVVKYLVEELGADVNARDYNGYTALHHAAARGDNEMILYLVEKGADVTVVSRRGQTTADMANGPVQRVSPFPETVALLMKLGSKNNNRCVTC